MKFVTPISLNVIGWSLVGLWRGWEERKVPEYLVSESLVGEVAICLPAHNEEVVIEKTIHSLQRLVPKNQIFVVSDGSTDATTALAQNLGCQVLALNPGQGKASALETLISHYNLFTNYRYIMIADADTTFSPDFLRNALQLLETNQTIAVVFAYGVTAPIKKSRRLNMAAFFHAYRTRLWDMLQPLLTYGQAWYKTNVYPVVPGFATVYRSSILKQLKINVPGQAIEDFNLAFQIHQQRLGAIVMHPSLIAYTQDPQNFGDYWRQVLRWNKGFFQAIKYWGIWPSFFWASLVVFLLENILIALIGFLMPAIATFMLLSTLSSGLSGQNPTIHFYIVALLVGFVGYIVLDYAVTLLIAIVTKNKSLVVYGLGFTIIHYINCLIFLYAIPVAFFTSSNGRWVSPKR